MKTETLVLNLVQVAGLACVAAGVWLLLGVAAGLIAIGVAAVVVGEGWNR